VPATSSAAVAADAASCPPRKEHQGFSPLEERGCGACRADDERQDVVNIPAERAEGHNGCNGCTRRSLGFAAVRSLDPKPLQTGGFGELNRTGANARQSLPCRRSWVRVPSSALKALQISRCSRLIRERWLHRGCTRSRCGARVRPAIWRLTRSPSGADSPCPATIPCNSGVLLESLVVRSTARRRGRSSFLHGSQISAEGHRAALSRLPSRGLDPRLQTATGSKSDSNTSFPRRAVP
jgi:hypothetical protein